MPPEHLDEGLAGRAARSARELPGVGILLLSQYVEERYATELLEHGADGVGYLLKERVADVDAVRRRHPPGRRAAAPCSTPRSSRT